MWPPMLSYYIPQQITVMHIVPQELHSKHLKSKYCDSYTPICAVPKDCLAPSNTNFEMHFSNRSFPFSIKQNISIEKQVLWPLFLNIYT